MRPMFRLRRPRMLAVVMTISLVGAAPAPAHAAVAPTQSAGELAAAMTGQSGLVRGARFVHRPPEGRYAAVATSDLVGFPRQGASYAILSTGDATLIEHANDSAATSTDNGGEPYRGTVDTVVLRVDLAVPRSARCLSFSFRFLSEEFDEFVGSDFNDGFLAELDRSTWSSRPDAPDVAAPRNFAVDREHRRITVNSTGDFSVTAARASGTTYDGATRRLRASEPITPGRHSLYLTIFDQGDRHPVGLRSSQ